MQLSKGAARIGRVPGRMAWAMLAAAVLQMTVVSPAMARKSKALAALQSVTLEPQPAHQATLMTRAKGSAAFAGVIGVAVAQQLAKRPNELSALIGKAGIDSSAMAAEAMRAQLTDRSILNVVEQGGDAAMRIESTPVGAPAKGGYVVAITIKVSIVDGSGKVVWDHAETAAPESVPAVEFDVLFNDPEKVAEQLRASAAQAAKILASRIYVARL